MYYKWLAFPVTPLKIKDIQRLSDTDSLLTLWKMPGYSHISKYSAKLKRELMLIILAIERELISLYFISLGKPTHFLL